MNACGNYLRWPKVADPLIEACSLCTLPKEWLLCYPTIALYLCDHPFYFTYLCVLPAIAYAETLYAKAGSSWLGNG